MPEFNYSQIRGILYKFPDYFAQGGRAVGWRLLEAHRAPPPEDTLYLFAAQEDDAP